jgi:3',5'-cyclic AMP phosphodiesterase CpdA
MRLIHVTDPHLSTLDGERFLSLTGKRRSGYLSWRKNRRKHYLPSVLNELTAAVRAEEADQILCTGDLVHIGLASEISQASEWLTSLAPAERLMLVPGNHDIYAMGSAGAVFQSWSDYLFQGLQATVGDDVTSQFPVVRKLGKLSLIGLSTACVTPIFMATGELGHEQLRRLDKLLQEAAAENQMVVLLIHHPPLPGMTNWRKALRDAAALEAVLMQHPPAMIFYGHLHHNHETTWGDTRIYCTAAASSVSDASYRVIDIEDHGGHWALESSLKTISIDNAAKELQFVTIDKQSWQLAKA